jgi:hypothetical protein
MNTKVFYDSSDSYRVNVRAPLALTSNRIITWPNASGEVALNNNAGLVYYVNNITGSATANGLSWNEAVDQVSTAITLSEAARLASWGGATLTNHTLRNTIFVQGTGTAYTSLTSLPSFCDIVGVGACPFGDGSGIPVIGTNTAALDAVAAASTRGVGLYNLQFQHSGGGYALDLVDIFRSEIAGCAFKATDPTLLTVHSDGAIRITGAAGGLYVHDNKCIGGNDSWHEYGLYADGTFLNSCRFENNTWRARLEGIHLSATVKGDNTEFKGEIINGGQQTLALGINDLATAGQAIYCGCYISATKSNVLSNAGETRYICNYWKNDFDTVNAT